MVESWNIDTTNEYFKINPTIIKNSKTFQEFKNINWETKKINRNMFKEMIETELQKKLNVSGPERLKDWDYGWGELLLELEKSKSLNCLEPQYFGKYPYIRFNNELYEIENNDLEKTVLKFIIQLLIELTLPVGVEQYYEFGCGTGHHLFKLKSKFKDRSFCGLDWSIKSQEIINLANDISGLDIQGRNFDYFNPFKDKFFLDDSIFFTVASMEQIGTDFENFVQFVLHSKPKIVIHVEPMYELFDDFEVIEKLTKEYMEKRNYLRGYLSRLRELEKQNKIDILAQFRTNIGSVFLEGYSILIFKMK
jgi:hypothetical protein